MMPWPVQIAIRHSVLAVSFVFVACTSVQAQDTNTFKGISSWTYRQDIDEGGWLAGPYRPQVSLVYTNASGDWIVGIRSSDAPPMPKGSQQIIQSIGVVHNDDCIVDVLNADTLQNPPCVIPETGASWRTNGRNPSVMHLVRHEHIDVPAGSFDALRFESTRFSPDGDGVVTGSATYWYAPEVHSMVRVERHFQSAGGMQSSMTEVLTSYTQDNIKKNAHGLDRSRSATFRMTPECKPAYPLAAIQALATGVTRVQIVIGSDGQALRSRVVHPAGTTREHLLLDQAAQESLSRCHFDPALSENSEPIASSIELSYKWALD